MLEMRRKEIKRIKELSTTVDSSIIDIAFKSNMLLMLSILRCQEYPGGSTKATNFHYELEDGGSNMRLFI